MLVLRTTPHSWRQKLRQALVLLSCLSATAYFCFHAVHGRYGLKAHAKLTDEAALLNFEIESLSAKRNVLFHDVSLLSQRQPPADLVDEIARDVLGFVDPSDMIYPTHK